MSTSLIVWFITTVSADHQWYVGAALNLAAICDLPSAVESQTREILHFPGASEIVIFRKPQKWAKELRIAQQKGYPMDQYGKETPQPTRQFKVADRLTQSPLGVTQQCFVLVFPLQ